MYLRSVWKNRAFLAHIGSVIGTKPASCCSFDYFVLYRELHADSAREQTNARREKSCQSLLQVTGDKSEIDTDNKRRVIERSIGVADTTRPDETAENNRCATAATPGNNAL